MNNEVNLHEGLIYIMVTMSAVDSSMVDEELERIGRLVRFLPVFERFDENDILSRALKTGIYSIDKAKATISPSMDIQISSNFERLLFEAYDRNSLSINNLII